MHNKFWVEDPCILLLDPVFIPSPGQSRDQKLNALTRLVILVTVILYMCEYEHWLLFLVVAILVIVIIHSVSKNRKDDSEKSKEHFTFTNRYSDMPYERTPDGGFMTTLPPPQAETNLLPPMNYDTGTTELVEVEGFNSGDLGDSYMTHTSLLPETEMTIVDSQPPMSLNKAMDYANNSWIFQRDINHRQDMINRFRRVMNQRNISGNYMGYRQPSCVSDTQPYVFP